MGKTIVDEAARDAIEKLAYRLGYSVSYYDISGNALVLDEAMHNRVRPEYALERAREATKIALAILDHFGLAVFDEPAKMVVREKKDES